MRMEKDKMKKGLYGNPTVSQRVTGVGRINRIGD